MKRKNALGTPRALDATRTRRGSQQTAGGRAVGAGQDIDASGRISGADGPEFYYDDQKRRRIRVDGLTLEVSAHSPTAIRARLGRGMETGRDGIDTKIDGTSIRRAPDGSHQARPSASEVLADSATTSLGSNVSEMILRLQTNKANAADVAASVAALQALINANTSAIEAAQAAIAALQANTVGAGQGLSGGGSVPSNPVLAAAFGTTSGMCMQGNDSRVTPSIVVCTGATVNLTNTGDVIVEIDNSAANCTVNLMAATSALAGRRVTCVVTGYSAIRTITCAVTGGSLIEGAASVLLTLLGTMRTWYCTGTAWRRCA